MSICISKYFYGYLTKSKTVCNASESAILGLVATP